MARCPEGGIMQTYRSIHYMRAVAALMVVLFHIHAWALLPQISLKPYIWLAKGVDIFFVISGFVIVKSTERTEFTGFSFLVRRIQRIAPLYWLLTLFLSMFANASWKFIIASLLFIPMNHPVRNTPETLIAQGYTLNYEMFFYGIFALSFVFAAKWRFYAVAAVIVGLVRFGPLPSQNTVMSFYSNPMMLEFVAGMAIAKFSWKLPAVFVPVGILLLAIGDRTGTTHQFVNTGMPAAIVIMGALSLERHLKPNAAANLLGDSSYALYLVHGITILTMAPFTDSSRIGYAASIAIHLLTAVTTAIVLHLWVEKPIAALFMRWRRTPGHAVTPLPVRR